MENLDVLYTTDHNYLSYMLVSIYSLLENNKDIDITIHIVYDKFDEDDFKRVKFVVDKFSKVNVVYYDYNDIYNKISNYNVPNWRDSRIAIARIFFTKYLPSVEHILYLDSDTIIVNSLKNLDKYNETISMVQDRLPTSYRKSFDSTLDRYYNSGVIWINVEKWKEDNCDESIEEVLNSNINLTYPDQDILNKALKDKIELLPLEYNMFPADYKLNVNFLKYFYSQYGIETYPKQDILDAKKNPVIFHSTRFFDYSQDNPAHPFNSFYTYYYDKIYNNGQYKPKRKFSLTRLAIYSKLIIPKKIKEKIKQYIKK